MRKSVKKMGTEALCWEVVQTELNLQACQSFGAAILCSIQQMPYECREVSNSIMSSILKLEASQREKMVRLELEQARRRHDCTPPDCHYLGAAPVSTIDRYDETEHRFEPAQHRNMNVKHGLTRLVWL